MPPASSHVDRVYLETFLLAIAGSRGVLLGGGRDAAEHPRRQRAAHHSSSRPKASVVPRTAIHSLMCHSLLQINTDLILVKHRNFVPVKLHFLPLFCAIAIYVC